MEKHHQECLDKFVGQYKQNPSTLAIILGGSLAHGFAKPDADIDICLLVDAEEFQRRKATNQLAFSLWDICTYEQGYVDCKVVDLAFLETIAQRGSDPARYAFKDCTLLFSREDTLPELLARIAVYPIHQIEERRNRFASQILAWKWYYSEAIKKQNTYLVFLSLQKIVLFSSRIVLNENALLYPYHKWMLKVVETADKKPARFLEKVDDLFKQHSLEKVNRFCLEMLAFIHFNEQTVDWPNYFLKDSEQNWLEHEPPVDDL
ncbi:MAG: nucleotidyltransferase domain-containing protein [Anaerolineae bacterium]|nr:nucleotidyltransferase domain-containing protein [Anaerolineae bacterium]